MKLARPARRQRVERGRLWPAAKRRRPVRRSRRAALPQRRPPESRRRKPKAWMLLAVIAIGAVVFLLVTPVVGNPIAGLSALVQEAQAVLAPTPGPPDAGAPLVPRRDDAPVELLDVPVLLNLDRLAARERALGVGLSLVVEEAFSETVPQGLVMAQDPSPGTAQSRGEPVRVTVSQGRARAAMPNVVGLPVAAARETLEGGGFQVLERLAFNEDVPAGTVLRQEPLAGALVDRRSVVTLHVSRGVEQITLPTLVGRTEDDARRAIELAGLRLGEAVYRETGSVPDGIVESQTPNAGARAPRGSEVGLIIVRVGEVQVPNVTGQPLAAAERELLDRELLIGVLTRIPTPGRTEAVVIGQEPGPGAKVPRWFGLRLLVAIPVEATEAPATPTVPSG